MRLRNGTVATVLVFITTFLSLSWYTAWQNGKGKENLQNLITFMWLHFCVLLLYGGNL